MQYNHNTSNYYRDNYSVLSIVMARLPLLSLAQPGPRRCGRGDGRDLSGKLHADVDTEAAYFKAEEG